MPRAQASREGRILQFFRTTDLAIARLVLDLSRDAVREREQRSADAKGRAASPAATGKGKKRAKRRTGAAPTADTGAGEAGDAVQ